MALPLLSFVRRFKMKGVFVPLKMPDSCNGCLCAEYVESSYSTICWAIDRMHPTDATIYADEALRHPKCPLREMEVSDD